MPRPKATTTFFFVRARAFEINFDIAPKRLYARMLTENATPQEQTKLAGADFVRACAVEMHMAMSQEPISCRNLQGKMPETRWTQCLGKKQGMQCRTKPNGRTNMGITIKSCKINTLHLPHLVENNFCQQKNRCMIWCDYVCIFTAKIHRCIPSN